MLKSLSIENFALAKKVSLDWGAGFCAITGETGAGKSMLVDALSLALGARAEQGWIRQGEDAALVSALFEIQEGSKAGEWIEQKGFGDAKEVSLRRRFESAGRSRAWINGKACSVAELKELGALMAVIHGQREALQLLDRDGQLALLDAAAGEKGAQALGAYKKSRAEWQKAKQALETLQERSNLLERERSALGWELEMLDKLDPKEGEWERLAAEHDQLARSEELSEAMRSALDALGSEEGAERQLRAARQKLESFAQSERIKAALEALDQAEQAAIEARREIERHQDAQELSPEELARVEARMSALHETAKKLREDPSELASRRHRARARLSELEESMDIEELSRAEAEARARARSKADELTELRKKASESLLSKANESLAELGMGASRIGIRIGAKELMADGADSIELTLSQGRSEPMPLAKTASGGELARIGLALSLATRAQGGPGCLIFDEVDTGVGGETALAVGRMLAALGESAQTLAVTHLPQVAACAAHHWKASKELSEGLMESRARALSPAERESELARMLGGSENERAIELARSMLSRESEPRRESTSK